ncbi:MAG: hypothetical protein HQ525_08770 [Anaerolineae bacterium]|nr:hypothetical protein [Anaerolineae bacterium]
MTKEPINAEPVFDVSEDDKLWAALGYPIGIIAVVMLLMEDKKVRPFIKFHAVQSIATNVAFVILSTLISITVIGAFCVPVLWLVFFYWAYKAYQGEYIEIPVVTDFIKKQGWV